MAEELELSNYETMGFKTTETRSSEPIGSGRNLFRVGVLTLGILCILQAALNISLRLTFYSKENIDQFPLNGSVKADLCLFEQLQKNSSLPLSCCNSLLKVLLKKYHALEAERNLLQHRLNQLSEMYDKDFEFSGSGFYSPELS